MNIADLEAELALTRQQFARLCAWCQAIADQLEADGAPELADIRNQHAAEIAARNEQIAALANELVRRQNMVA